jgi:hypothetical protein
MPAGIVLYGLILFHSTKQTSGGAPKDDFQRGSKVEFITEGMVIMLIAALMMMLGVIGDILLLGNLCASFVCISLFVTYDEIQCQLQ